MKKIKREDYINELVKLNNINYVELGRNEFGVDCIGLPILALSKLNIKIKEDLSFYSPVGNSTDLINALSINCKLKNFKELEKGDILLIRYLSTPQHLAIFLGDYYKNGNNYIIHASNLSDKKVKIERFERWENRIISIYSFNFFEN